MAGEPFWLSCEFTAADAHLLGGLNDAADLQAVLVDECIRAIVNAAKSINAAWLYSFLYDKLRSDVQAMDCFDEFLKAHKGVLQNLDLKTVGGATKEDKVVACDKVAWLHSAMIGQLSDRFNEQEVADFVDSLKTSHCSSLGKVEAITNLLKSTSFRGMVWKHKGVQEIIYADTDQATQMYKVVFALWMLTYDGECMESLAGSGKAVEKIKKFLTSETKVEKVVRLSLVVLQAFLKSKALTEDLASNGLLEVVQSLGYEKYRDNDLYEQIRALGQSIQSAVSEVSNYERYVKELKSGILTRGYLHSGKFWAENFSKFTERDVKDLSNCLNSQMAETQAIACFDLGELAVLHRDGKKWIAAAGAKEQVMNLMTGASLNRELRREALLCCQKIMLKWQEVPMK
jgi:V-type H+-transporting ATPase subunit H